jgi:murein L,D-transpeptidase YafK
MRYVTRVWILIPLVFATGCASQAASTVHPMPPPTADIRLRQVVAGVPDGPLALAVFKQKRQLVVLRHGIPERTFYVYLGSNPSGPKIWRGDNRTPEGIYRVCQIKPSRFKTFLWLSYPNEADARKALEAGQITFGEYQRIVQAQEDGQCPPADTALGGLVGIHGDYADPPRHYDWTEGCIALPGDAELEQLVGLVHAGTPVVIFP